MDRLSPKRARLASFENAYAVATQLRRASGQDQYVIRTSEPLQPILVTPAPPAQIGLLLALVL